MELHGLILESLHAAPLAVPLHTPFVIASARVDVTANVLVRVQVRDPTMDRRVEGLGEAATLWPVTLETQGDVLANLQALAQALPLALTDPRLTRLPPCARAGVDMAVLDGVGKLQGKPLYQLLNPQATLLPLTTDVTIAIADPAEMARQAAAWSQRGFACFKVKVGRDMAQDLRALTAIVQEVPHCTLRIDANGGYTADDALAFCAEVAKLRLPVACFEQPCATEDHVGLARVAREAPFAVIADESCKSLTDLDDLIRVGACDGVNLKLVKAGGLAAAYAIGKKAQAHGLSLMVGAMVETRLGIAAAAHLTVALGGVAYPDLDTAFLLREDPFVGGYLAEGPHLALTDAPGLGVTLA
jgi:L-alanine-DL-glutamate epimerase-like enolase superfamily enzyme